MEHHYSNEDPDQYRGKCKCGKPGTFRIDPTEKVAYDAAVKKRWICDDCFAKTRDGS